VFSLIYFLLTLSILVLAHEFGHFAVAKKTGVRVEKFSFGFGPKILSFKKGDTEYLISLIPLGGYVKMAGDEPRKEGSYEKWEFLSKSVTERFGIIFAGPLLNYLLAFIIFSVIFMFGSPTITTEVGGLLSGYPAQKEGIVVGDKILAVDGNEVKFWEDMTELIHKRVDGAIKLAIERDGARFEREISPLVRRTKDIFGKEIKVALIGIMPSQEIVKVRYGPIRSVQMGLKKIGQLTLITYKALWSIVIGRLSFKESMTGPIGIFMITGQAARMGFLYIFHLMGILSVSLAIFNLLPFPVLDGGHIIFLAVEKVRGKPLSIRAQELIANIGISFLILLALFTFYSDIMKFGIFEKAVTLFKR